jgi:hypothetical protein
MRIYDAELQAAMAGFRALRDWAARVAQRIVTGAEHLASEIYDRCDERGPGSRRRRSDLRRARGAVGSACRKGIPHESPRRKAVKAWRVAAHRSVHDQHAGMSFGSSILSRVITGSPYLPSSIWRRLEDVGSDWPSLRHSPHRQSSRWRQQCK